MMGVTHAITGATVWQVGCLIAATEGHLPGTYVVVVGTALCAFGALLPDIDMPGGVGPDGERRPGSLVAQSLWFVTQAVAQTVAMTSALVHANSRAPADKPNRNGHRGLTHTLAFCLFVMLAFGALGQYGGAWAPLAVVFWAAATAIRAMLPPGRRSFSLGRVFSKLGDAAKSTAKVSGRKGARRWRAAARWLKRLAWLTGFVHVPTAPFGALVVAAVMWRWPAPSGWWLGYAIAAGCLVHCLGDAMTHSGVPLLWPWPVQGQVWYPVRPRPEWRFKTGGRKSEQVSDGVTVKVISEDRVEENVLAWSSVAVVLAGAGVAYLTWWPTVLSWTAAVQAWWPKR